MTGRWEHFPHGADIGIRGFGVTKAQAFEQAATALSAVITEPASIKTVRCVQVQCDAPDDELLLVEWLNALVFEMAVGRLLFRRFAVEIDGLALHGRAWGEPVDVARHEPAVEVKGATVTCLRVERQQDGRWVAQCVVDV